MNEEKKVMSMICILEDDESIRKLVTYTLERSGYEAVGCERPSEFYKELERKTPELVLLDIMLPEEDGLSVLSRLRASSAWSSIPVIMMTAKNTEYDKVIGLDAGADDYIAKPFGMMELLARIRALLRRSERPTAERVFRTGCLAVYPEAYRVTVEGKEITLTRKEFDLLLLLVENGGRVLTRDVIMDRVWGDDYDGENRTVDVHIRTLRTKLGKGGECVETVRGVGYKMVTDQ